MSSYDQREFGKEKNNECWFYVKEYVYGILASLLVMRLCIMPTYAWRRKLITKPISGSLDVSGNIMNYSFNSTAGITYNDSNNITDISDLSFGYITITMSNQNIIQEIQQPIQYK